MYLRILSDGFGRFLILLDIIIGVPISNTFRFTLEDLFGYPNDGLPVRLIHNNNILEEFTHIIVRPVE